MLRVAGAIVLGVLVTLASTFALTSLGYQIFLDPDPTRWLFVAAMLGAATIPFFLGSMVAAYVAQRSGWKIGLAIFPLGVAFFLAEFRPAALGPSRRDTVFALAMAFGL